MWILGGLAEPETRLWFWAAALAIWTAAPLSYFYVPGLGASSLKDWSLEPHHLAERCSLFIILALGESILILGATFAGLTWSWQGSVTMAAALAGTIAMWWCYFNIGAERAEDRIDQSDHPGGMARNAYTYLHAPIGAGIVTSAAAVKWAIAHPTGHAEPYQIVAGLGGPALYLAGLALFKRASGAPNLPLSHGVGLLILGGLLFVAVHVQPWQLAMAVTGVMIMVAIWETLSLGPRHRAEHKE